MSAQPLPPEPLGGSSHSVLPSRGPAVPQPIGFHTPSRWPQLRSCSLTLRQEEEEREGHPQTSPAQNWPHSHLFCKGPSRGEQSVTAGALQFLSGGWPIAALRRVSATCQPGRSKGQQGTNLPQWDWVTSIFHNGMVWQGPVITATGLDMLHAPLQLWGGEEVLRGSGREEGI